MIPLARPDLSGKEREYLLDAFDSGWISSRGPYVERFEEEFGDFVGRPAASCSSGTAALHLALLASGIGPGDEVIVPDLTYCATAAAVVHVGAKPILVDVGDDWTIGPEQIAPAITSRTKAIIPVHLYGMACDMHAVMDFARYENLTLIEDCAEAIATYIGGTHVGTFGHYGCFSFYANKHMTTGEGGMVVSNDVERVKAYRDAGNGRQENGYKCELAGLNYRMTNLQAAIGCAQLEHVVDIRAAHTRCSRRYKARLRGRGSWMYVAELEDRPAAAMALVGVCETRPVFCPLHMHEPFAERGAYPNALDAYNTGLCLPTGPHVTDADIDLICDTIEGSQ